MTVPRPWRARPLRAQVAASLIPWLTDPASLTTRIRARSRAFAVRVVRQQLDRPLADEAQLLGLAPRQLVWVREVVLQADGRAVVYARSVWPCAHVRGGWHIFHGLGARPLGEVLFANPRIERSPLLCARLDRRDPRYDRAVRSTMLIGAPAALWARSSVFRLRHHALLVAEVFLPAVATLPA